jgi:UDP-N-acetyl-2-amino-2-deoxyglucuronate dehydrogenase
MGNEETVRLGLVGLGGWGHAIALAAERRSDVEIARCYARSPEARADFAARHRCIPCDHYEEMLADPAVQGIIVMSANRAHREHVVAASRAGKHCLVTKPLATTIEDGRAMIDSCREAGVILAVGQQSRREPAIRALKAILETGELGVPVLAEADISSGDGLSIEPGEWRWLREECVGGPLMQLGIHHVDTLQYLLGPIARVQGWQRRAHVRAEIDDVTATLLEFAAGPVGYLGSAYATGETCWIKISGTHAIAHYDQHMGLSISRDSWEGGPVRESRASGMDLRAPIGTLREELAEFVECIRTGKPPEVDGVAGLRNLAVVLAAVESGRTGKAVAVDGTAA